MYRYLFLLMFIFLLNSCNVGANKNISGNNYGIVVSGGTAPINSIMQNFGLNSNGVIPILNLDINQTFLSIIPCYNLISSTGLNFFNNCTQNINYIASNPNIFGINKSTNVVQFVENSVAKSNISYAKLDYLQYTSPGLPIASAGQTIPTLNLSGLIILPTDANGNIVDSRLIKGILLYYHDTIPSKNGVMSGFNNSDSISMGLTFLNQYILTAVFVSNGYIVLAPDYPGQGIDVNTFHPYIIGLNENAYSGIYMLQAAQTYLKNKYNFDIKTMINPNLFISSFSEGGGYSLRATEIFDFDNKSILNNLGLSLIKTIAISGAYDISNTMLNYAYSNVYAGDTPDTNKWNAIPGCNRSGSTLCPNEENGLDRAIVQYALASSKPTLSAYLISSILTYYYNSNGNYSIFKPNFVNLSSCINLITSYTLNNWSSSPCVSLFNFKGLNIFDLFNNVNNNAGTIDDILFTSAMSLGYFIGNTTSVSSLINILSTQTTTFNNIGIISYNQTPSDKWLLNILSTKNTYNIKTNTNISLLYLKYDSTVPNINSKLACNPITGIRTLNGASVNCIEIDNTNLFDSIKFPGETSNIMYLYHQDSNKIISLAVLNQMNLAL